MKGTKMSQPKITVTERDTNLRSGGSTHGPNNIITVLHDPATYVAYEQCAGEEVQEGSYRNRWWVRIEVPLEHTYITGWVSAVRIDGGDNGKAILGVPESPTRFESSTTSGG
jgi:hypothetical protein